MPPEPRSSRTDQRPQLIAYSDRLGGSLAGLDDLMHGPLRGAFGGVHILPFYRPYDGADAGFDPEDHTSVDPRLGSWEDVRAIARDQVVMADLIVNHMSSRAPQFVDVLERGDESPWRGMFLTMSSIFPNGATEADLAAIYRPRPGLPFTAMTLGGRRRLVWTTFSPEQIDLDIRHARTWTYLTDIVDQLTVAGVTMLRLDAVGYVGKQAGTDCFMTEPAREFIQRLREYAASRGASVLLEVHGHYQQQLDIARTVDWVYDFALPPLVLYALQARDAEPLVRWLGLRPANTVTVLDTHDGIGIVDVGASPLRPGEAGLLSDEQIDALVESIHLNSGGTSRLATGAAASNLDLYQVNSTFYDAVGRDDHRYLLARLVQLFLPGIPQVYYVGLLAGTNDLDLLRRTNVGRDVNRHHYQPDEIEQALARPVVQAQLSALRLRADHPCFAGIFGYDLTQDVLTLSWSGGAETVALRIDFADLRAEITSSAAAVTVELNDPTTLAERIDRFRAMSTGARP